MRITPVLRNPTGNKATIFIRIHDGGTSPKYKSTGHKIKESNWNPNGNQDRKNWVRTTESNYPQINRDIYDMLIQITAEKQGLLKSDILKEKIPKGPQRPFLPYAHQQLELILNFRTRTNQIYALKKLHQYLELNDSLSLKFSEIDKKFTKNYYTWLLQNIATSSANLYIGIMRTIYNQGLDEMNHVNSNNPFTALKYKKSISTNKALEPRDYIKFRDLNTGVNYKWLLFKNAFLFQFSGAYRSRDVIMMQWKHLRMVDETIYLDIHSSKTQSRIFRELFLKVQLLLLPCLDRYFPKISKTVEEMNNTLNLYKTQRDKLFQDLPEPLTPIQMIKMMESGYGLVEIKSLQESEGHHQKELEEMDKKIIQLENRLSKMMEKALLELSYKHPKQYIFPWGNIHKWNSDYWTQQHENSYNSLKTNYNAYLKRMAKEADIRVNLSSHTARHTSTTMLRDMGFDLNAISELLQHSSLPMTELYAKRLGNKNNELSRQLSDLL